jgi:thiopurine S-methyltransferase
MTDRNFWLDRWVNGETGWHQDEVEENLVEYFPADLSNARVFVPLCGKSRDLAWLASKGHQVTGVEFSEMAARAFFEESGVKPEQGVRGPFQSFTSDRVTILVGDFFALTPEILGPVDLVYDRAALIALPPPTRVRYAAGIKSLARGARILELVMEREPADDNGPPFSVSSSEIASLYGDDFEIRPLYREWFETDRAPSGRALDCVYLLSPRRTLG